MSGPKDGTGWRFLFRSSRPKTPIQFPARSPIRITRHGHASSVPSSCKTYDRRAFSSVLPLRCFQALHAPWSRRIIPSRQKRSNRTRRSCWMFFCCRPFRWITFPARQDPLRSGSASRRSDCTFAHYFVSYRNNNYTKEVYDVPAE